ncbi:hypothetical protein VPH35_044909 [Triticum aestivum]|uniref:Uncharacterized protein n=1 Tax=Triticum urartu TaxID=4572 RepID=A0A8R7TWK8_TRIUA
MGPRQADACDRSTGGAEQPSRAGRRNACDPTFAVACSAFRWWGAWNPRRRHEAVARALNHALSIRVSFVGDSIIKLQFLHAITGNGFLARWSLLAVGLLFAGSA